LNEQGKTEISGKYYQFYQHIQKRNADAAKTFLERLKAAAKAGATRICMWVLERRFPEDFGNVNIGKQLLFQRIKVRMLR